MPPPDPDMQRGAGQGTPNSQTSSKPYQDTQAARELQEVFGRPLVVVRETIGRRFRTRAPR